MVINNKGGNVVSVKKRVEEAIHFLQQGKLIIVADDENREAEGDLIGLAQYATSETLNQMVTEARGLVCVPMSAGTAGRLGLGQMTIENTDVHGTAFTISVDHHTTTTGISTAERALTIRELANPEAKPSDFLRPGHIFPLVGQDNGAIVRAGHTETAVDLARLAGAQPVAYICEILNTDGTMARRPELKEQAVRMAIPFITVADVVRYRHLINDRILEADVQVDLPTEYGDFKVQVMTSLSDKKEQIVVSKGEFETEKIPLIRLHSECMTGDIFGSHRCECGEQLAEALQRIEADGTGAVLYLRQEGRGIGLVNKLRAYQLQEQGRDTYDANIELGFEADGRDYGIAAAMLKTLGIQRIRLLTNNLDKVTALQAYGIEVVERIALQIAPRLENKAYLKTKQTKFNHQLTID